MFNDNETNKVYFSYQSTFDFKSKLKELKNILDESNIEWGMINGTKDFFCRDYMPVQVEEKTLVRFVFRPDHLLNNPEQCMYVTDTNLVFKNNDFLNHYRIVNSCIILDGGNVVKCKSRVIITDKVFIDNPLVPDTELIQQIELLLGVQVIIIPRIPDEATGHADGLIRFVDENTVLTINLKYQDKLWREKFLQVLHDTGLKVISLPDLPHYSKDNWAYINFLWVKDLIIVPALNEVNDVVIERFFKETFNGSKIRMVKANRILAMGGGLNCFTWTIAN